MLIQYRGEVEETPRQTLMLGDVVLINGRKDVNPTDWKRALANPTLKAKVEEKKRLGIIIIESESHAGQSLKEKTVPDAIAVIKDTFDLDLLKEWRDNDERKGVAHALEEQLAKIEQPEPPDEGK
jgi:hypothetical protein